MMKMSNIRMKTRVKTAEVREILKRNLADHETILKEARDKYRECVIKELKSRLEAAEKGEPVANFIYNPPVSHASVYRTAFMMVEMNQDETMLLEPDEFRQLILDEWDWTASFLAQNRVYSTSAALKYRATIAAEDEEYGASLLG